MSLFFMHITKTAGGTIKRLLREADIGAQFHYPGEDNFSAGFAYPDDCPVVYGHYRFGAHQLMKSEPKYGCFVREPIARTVSHFHHLKNVAKIPVGDRAREHQTIDVFLQNTKSMDMDNLQTRMLSGIGRDVGYDKLDESALELAVENLKKYFVFIGVFEDLHASVDQLGEIFPTLNPDLPHVNKGKYTEDMSAAVRAEVVARNEFDLRLYEEVLKMKA